MRAGVEHDVPVLRIYLHSAVQRPTSPDAGGVAVFEVLRGSRPPLQIATEPTARLGLKDVIRSAEDARESAFTIPDDLRKKLVDGLNQVATPRDPVYLLDLPAPHGYLHLVPWERLLSADIAVPLLRMPRYELVPHAKWPLQVVIVSGCSTRRTPFQVDAMVATAVGHWRSAFQDKPLAMDVFAPAGETDSVRRALTRLEDKIGAESHQLTVHEPPREDLDIGWRKWIGSALDDGAVDVVHLVGHGRFRAERGGFALPGIHNTARERSIAATELCAAMTSLGAWSLLLSAPTENDSPAALRDLSTAVTESRPGVVMLHQYSASGDVGVQAEQSLLMLTGQVSPVRMPDVACWHPLISAWFATHDVSVASASESSLTEPDGTSALIDDDTTSAMAQPNVPAWVASGARTLETLHAQLLSSASSPPNPDAVEALRNVSASFNQQVREWSNQHSDKGPA